jgi:hypothetical protein
MPGNPSAVLTGSNHSPPPGDLPSLDSAKGLTFNGRLPVTVTARSAASRSGAFSDYRSGRRKRS